MPLLTGLRHVTILTMRDRIVTVKSPAQSASGLRFTIHALRRTFKRIGQPRRNRYNPRNAETALRHMLGLTVRFTIRSLQSSQCDRSQYSSRFRWFRVTIRAMRFSALRLLPFDLGSTRSGITIHALRKPHCDETAEERELIAIDELQSTHCDIENVLAQRASVQVIIFTKLESAL